MFNKNESLVGIELSKNGLLCDCAEERLARLPGPLKAQVLAFIDEVKKCLK